MEFFVVGNGGVLNLERWSARAFRNDENVLTTFRDGKGCGECVVFGIEWIDIVFGVDVDDDGVEWGVCVECCDGVSVDGEGGRFVVEFKERFGRGCDGVGVVWIVIEFKYVEL